MNTRDDLKRQLAQIDHKGYKAYKVLEGVYEFGAYRLAIDHVQGDPFATPSRVRLLYQNGNNIPQEYFCTRARKTAAEDFLLRRLHRSLRAASGDGRKGSGKSGLITACRVGQDSSGKLFGPTSVAEVLLLMVNYFLNLVKKPLTGREG